MKKSVLLAVFVFASMPAMAASLGVCHVGGTAFEMKGAYAFQKTGARAAAGDVLVSFASIPIDARVLMDAFDRSRGVERQVSREGVASITLTIRASGELRFASRLGPDGVPSLLPRRAHALAISRIDTGHIAGSYKDADAAHGKQDHCDLAFDLDVVGPRDPGPPLPAGGGDPVAAYRDFTAAVLRGDRKTMLASMTRENAVDYDDDFFKNTFGRYRDGTLRELRYVKGFSKADSAIVEFTGNDASGNAHEVTIGLRKQHGRWCVDEELYQE